MARGKRGVHSDGGKTLSTPLLVAHRASPRLARFQRDVCHPRFRCVAQRTDGEANRRFGCRLCRYGDRRHDGSPHTHRGFSRHKWFSSVTGLRVARPGWVSATTCRRDGWTWTTPPASSMNPSFLNFPMKRFTRERVVPTISAMISCETSGSTHRQGRRSSQPASTSNVWARRRSLEDAADALLAIGRRHGEPDTSLLDVHHALARVALEEERRSR